jgi:hypothetical protein
VFWSVAHLMEDCMKNMMVPTIILLAALFVMVPAVGKSASTIEGTYTNNGGIGDAGSQAGW